MPTPPKHPGQPWTPVAVTHLETLADDHTPTRVMALTLQRTPVAVPQQAGQTAISLQPTNPSPSTRRITHT